MITFLCLSSGACYEKAGDAAYEEARQALEEYDDSLRKLEDNNTEQNEDSVKVTGKRTFGPAKNKHTNVSKRQKLEETENSDSEYDSDPAQHLGNNEAATKQDDIKLGTALLDDEQNDLYRVRCLYLQVIKSCDLHCSNLICSCCIM